MPKHRRIRVAIVVASIDILGGQAIQALRLLEGLSHETSIKADLIPINPRLPMPLRLLQRIKYLRTLITSIAYIVSLLIRLPRYDVVHVFSASYLSFLLAPTPAILISKLYGKPVLLNYHSGEAEDHLRKWPKTSLPILKMADRIVVPSNYLVSVFGKFGISAECIQNTVDLTRFRFRERRKLSPVLLSNRNLESHYNVECTLRAFALIQHRYPNAQLIVAGNGSQGPRLRELASRLRIQKVEFLGAVTPEAMPALYDRAELFVNASDVDNQPLSIIEAFAAGLPVVTTNAGGIPDMVVHNQTGLMIERGDQEGIADCVIQLLGDNELAERLARRAREEANRYAWPAAKDKWLRIYADLFHCRQKNAGNTVKRVQSSRARS